MSATSPSAGRGRSVVCTAALLLVLGGCGAREGTQPSSSAWREEADQVLGAAQSSFGTADLVLGSRLDDHLPRPFAVSSLSDAIDNLEKESSGFLASRPPATLSRADRQVVRTLTGAVAALHEINDAALGPERSEWRRALEASRKGHRTVSDVRRGVRESGR